MTATLTPQSVTNKSVKPSRAAPKGPKSARAERLTGQPAVCGRCGRRLSSTVSIERGYGRHCFGKVKALTAIVGNSTEARYTTQINKAIEVIEDAGVLRYYGAYLVVASNGLCAYAVDAEALTCTCTAGIFQKPCYHRAAVYLVTNS